MSEEKKVLSDDELENVVGGGHVFEDGIWLFVENGIKYFYLSAGACYEYAVWRCKVKENYKFPAEEVHQISVHSFFTNSSAHVDEYIPSTHYIFKECNYKGIDTW